MRTYTKQLHLQLSDILTSLLIKPKVIKVGITKSCQLLNNREYCNADANKKFSLLVKSTIANLLIDFKHTSWQFCMNTENYRSYKQPSDILWVITNARTF